MDPIVWIGLAIAGLVGFWWLLLPKRPKRSDNMPRKNKKSNLVTPVSLRTFQEKVYDADTPVLVDFFATWCPPCKALAPILEDVAGEYEGKVKFVKVDVDKHKSVKDAFGVTRFPTLVLIKPGRDGLIFIRSTGYREHDALRSFIEDSLKESKLGPKVPELS